MGQFQISEKFQSERLLLKARRSGGREEKEQGGEGSRVSKSHGLTVVQPRNIFLN